MIKFKVGKVKRLRVVGEFYSKIIKYKQLYCILAGITSDLNT